MSETPFRVLPSIDQENEFFWTSGRDGRLRFARCGACDYYVHPPAPICPQCLGHDVAPAAVSGRGTVFSFTVNHQPWDGSPEPYVIGLVQLEEQEDLRLTTNIVGCSPEDVRIGMSVRAVFEDHDPVFLPLFELVGG